MSIDLYYGTAYSTIVGMGKSKCSFAVPKAYNDGRLVEACVFDLLERCLDRQFGGWTQEGELTSGVGTDKKRYRSGTSYTSCRTKSKCFAQSSARLADC